MTEAPDQETWPAGLRFWPTRKIPYQIDYIARLIVMGGGELAADMGTGKSVMGLGVGGLCLEDGAIDGMLVICEPNKLREWLADFAVFTRISAAVYHGPRRKKLLADLPEALITTYETARDDLAVFPPKSSRSVKLSPGPLLEALAGRRLLILYDESTKLAHRTSRIYKAHYWATGELRRRGPLRVVGMTGTPMERDLEDIFNQLRLIVPEGMPTVTEFNRRVIKSRHPVYGTPSYHEDGKAWFRDLAAPWILRKRKSDPDVREYFPPFSEKFCLIPMHADQRRIYRLLEDLAWDPKDGSFIEVPGLNVLLRQLAGDPHAVLEAAQHGTSALAKMVAEEMRWELQQCSSAKAERLCTDVDLVLAAEAKAVVFTHFGQTVLPAVHARLGGRPVFTYHGEMTQRERDHQKNAFMSCSGGAILLSSDAGSRGINLPCSYIIEYDVAQKHSTRQQRAGRGHRLGHQDPVTFYTYVLEDTIESYSSVRTLLDRNETQDFILGDEGAPNFTTADNRREMFAAAKHRRAA